MRIGIFSETYTPYISGLVTSEVMLKNALEKEGVEEIPAVGEKFDPFKHEALLTVDSPNHENNEIVDELMKGYTLKDKVIKYSKVRVCKKAKKEE